jgi:hypothetical protein
MIKKLKKVLLAVALLATPMMADDSFGTEYSLVGFELGYGSIHSEVTDASGTNVVFKTNDTSLINGAIKLGAQSEHYRVLLSGRYAQDTDSLFDYVMDYEIEGDYLFNFSRYANFFIGIHGGVTYLKFVRPNESFSRTIDSPFYGGNLGFNIHATRFIDVELAGRYSIIDGSNTKNNVEYKFTDSYNLYCSIIFKYQLED